MAKTAASAAELVVELVGVDGKRLVANVHAISKGGGEGYHFNLRKQFVSRTPARHIQVR